MVQTDDMTYDRAGAIVMTNFLQSGPSAASHAFDALRLHRSSTRRQETYLQPVAPVRAALRPRDRADALRDRVDS